MKTCKTFIFFVDIVPTDVVSIISCVIIITRMVVVVRISNPFTQAVLTDLLF